jgi:hypothetical protein
MSERAIHGSPKPDVPPELDNEPKTDPAIRVVRDAVRKKLKPELRSELNWQGAKLTIAMVVVAIGTAFGAYEFILNEARAQTDAGVKGHETRLSAVEQTATADRAQNNTRFQRLEEGQLRTDKKLDALLDRLNVPNPAPAPKDGGM